MKVKDFIEWIRPITAVNPETEICILDMGEELDLSHWYFDMNHVDIYLKHKSENHG